MKKLLVLLLLLYPISASAVTYEWTDASGTVNFTEDLGKVPKIYRKKAKVLGADDSGAPQVIESTEPVKEKAKDAAARKDKKLYGGKDEAAWRTEIGTVKSNLQAAEQQVTELRSRLTDTSKMSRSEYLSIQTSIKHSEFSVEDLKRKLDQLEKNAAKAGVPAEAK